MILFITHQDVRTLRIRPASAPRCSSVLFCFILFFTRVSRFRLRRICISFLRPGLVDQMFDDTNLTEIFYFLTLTSPSLTTTLTMSQRYQV